MRPGCVYFSAFLHIEVPLRTNIDIDDALLAEAMTATGLSTKKAAVEEALRALVRQSRRRRAIDDLAGLGWQGDLDALRQDRERDPRP